MNPGFSMISALLNDRAWWLLPPEDVRKNRCLRLGKGVEVLDLCYVLGTVILFLLIDLSGKVIGKL